MVLNQDLKETIKNMKHLLNNLSSEEKNSILEQHKGGMPVNTSMFKRLIESKSGDVKPLINEEEEQLPTPNVSDLERNELSDKMLKDIVDIIYLDEVINPTTKVPYRLYNVGGKLDYNMVYRENMEYIDRMLSKYGFPDGIHIPENITRQEFEELKNKWEETSKILSDINQ